MSDQDYKRTEHELPLHAAIANALGENAVPEAASWSEERWAEREAELEAKRKANEARELEAARRSAIDEMVEQDGWPRRAVEAALEADLDKGAIVKLRELQFGDRNIIVISGAPGCGKTVGVAWWALQQRRATKFVRASTFAAASRYDREERMVWLKAYALVLDDAGAEYSDAKGSLMVDLDELIDVFYGDRRPLMITTNCNVSDFKKRYGDRITDRLRECGRWVSVDGGSLRKKT